MIQTDYTKIAPGYNARYSVDYLIGIENELQNIITSSNYKNILEAGCGTGRWIKSIKCDNCIIYGLDYSLSMLKIPKTHDPTLNILNADATNFPFVDNYFDLIFCVNAIHHFPEKEKFISECSRTLINNGMITIVGVDPHIDKEWYIYNYFDSVYENDLKRFLSFVYLKDLFEAEGFGNVTIKIIEKIRNKKIGADVFKDPFLGRLSCSQLANLSDEEYQRGVNKIQNQINKNPETVFTTSIIFYLISANKNNGV